jgi:hypothetical protein
MFCRSLSLLLLASTAVLAADDVGLLRDEWKYDVLYRKRGVPLRGLIVEQGASAVQIRCISRKPGSPTVVFTENVPRGDVASLKLLGDADRKLLEQRLDSLKREREVLARRLRALDPKRKAPGKSGDAFDLRPAAWPGDPKIKALSYQSAHFRLVSNCRPELVQLAAIHLEEVYAAYVRCLPPRTASGTPTTVLLTGSLGEYQAIVKSRGLNLFNPAFYDPNHNQVVCGSDLERLCDELEKVRNEHARLRLKINDSKAELAKVYRGKVPAELLAPLLDAEKRFARAEMSNDETFAKRRDRLFTRLYHEAFHAYLNTFVYPSRDGALPLWFNEGLAQIFETAIVEVGELRVGHADEKRLSAIRKALAHGKLLSLTDLLRSTPKHFQVAHRGEGLVSDRYYLASWGLAFYLTFEKRLLGTKALDDYVAALKRGSDVLDAFADLVGKPLGPFEKEYQQYLGKLRRDGTTGK